MTKPETISVTSLREQTRRVIEDVHFRGRNYVVERAGQQMVVIMSVDEYQRLLVQSTPEQQAPPHENHYTEPFANLINRCKREAK